MMQKQFQRANRRIEEESADNPLKLTPVSFSFDSIAAILFFDLLPPSLSPSLFLSLSKKARARSGRVSETGRSGTGRGGLMTILPLILIDIAMLTIIIEEREDIMRRIEVEIVVRLSFPSKSEKIPWI